MIVLHGSAESPYVMRVRMQAYAKELPLEHRMAVPGTPEFQKLNPLGKVPVLEHDGFILPESQVISEYLEDVYPTPSLLGETSQDRARVRLVTRTVDLYCGGVSALLRAAADPAYKVDTGVERAGLEKGLDALETFLAADGYAVGGRLSLADCTLVAWLFYGDMLTKSGDTVLSSRRRLSSYHAFAAGQALTQRVWGEMDVAFRAFMSRWAAEQAAKKAT